MEDDAFFQKFYSIELQEKGYEVIVAENGEIGLKKAPEFKPDLILLDIIMPKKDGFEVLKELAKKPALKKIPVLIFSTLGQEKDVEKAKELGAKDYVNKSFFDLDALLTKISEVMKS